MIVRGAILFVVLAGFYLFLAGTIGTFEIVAV